MHKPTTPERGYGYHHQQERKRWLPIIKRGGVVCSCYGIDPECHGEIQPDEEWHLDHDDTRTGYEGPAHALCNLRKAGRKRARLRAGTGHDALYTSEW